MAVWAHRVEGQLVGGGGILVALTCPADRTVILSTIDIDVSVGAAGSIQVGMNGPSAGTTFLFSGAALAPGVLNVPCERRVLVPGDQLQLFAGAGYTIEWWVSYLLLVGAPS